MGVESPTAVGGFTGAGLLAGGCGNQQSELQKLVEFTGAGLLAGGCGYHVGVESPTAVGGFRGAGLLAGGCGISS